MWKPRIKPREFRFRAGARTELDQAFLKIVGNLSPEANLSEFIKSAVVENELRKSEQSPADRMLRESSELLEKVQFLKGRMQQLDFTALPPQKAGIIKKVLFCLEQFEVGMNTVIGENHHE
ncbi:hypothetical protein EDC14_103646 [Hydrogenispora ethanolica]|uniref:Uncharacterized protein n=1 Tax=Hydrogenispora ethanolica TaxID=1082276 RepID=A0A4R1R4A3_HYDET|nr:hypothetical protein [Hydrogenispora ethanolica]TCL60293.1 hypothetical protein EDC14_103646 [Hydrogenispora ethanolica]